MLVAIVVDPRRLCFGSVNCCAQAKSANEMKTTTTPAPTITRNEHELEVKNANIVSNDKNLLHFAVSVRTQNAPQPNNSNERIKDTRKKNT